MNHRLSSFFLLTFLLTSVNTDAMHLHTRHRTTNDRAGLFIGAITAGVIFAPVIFRILRWGKFQLKSFDTRHKEAHALLEKYERRYGPSLSTIEQLNNLNASDKNAEFRQVALECYEQYNVEEGYTWIETFRRMDWLSQYGSLVRYPFLHYENRLSNAISWLQQYQRSLSGSSIANKLDREIILLQRLLTHVRTSYEYHQEKNQKHQDDQLKALQAQQLQQQLQQQQQHEEVMLTLQTQQQQAPAPSAPPYDPDEFYDNDQDDFSDAPPAYSKDDSNPPPKYSVNDPNPSQE